MARRRRRRAMRPLPLALAVFLVGVMIVLAYHWREHERQRRAVAQAERAVVLDAARIEPALDGRRVRARGVLRGEGELRDPIFGARAEGLLLLREVAMWQWHEEQAPDGSRRYRAGWSAERIDSSRFQRAAEHPNPERLPFRSERFRPARLRLGAYLVPAELADALAERAAPLPFRSEWLPENLAASFLVHQGELHTAEDPKRPAIGDLRIRYRVLAPLAVGLEAVPSGGRLDPRGEPRPLP
jgi:hypothetical protein